MIPFLECRNNNREYLGNICNAISIIWQVEYVGTGNFEITVPFNATNFSWLQEGYYITRIDRTELGFIEKVVMKYSANEGRTLTVSGRFGCVLLERRIFFKPIQFGTRAFWTARCAVDIGANIETSCRDIVDKTLINATTLPTLDANRNISWLSLGTLNGFSETTTTGYENTIGNALEAVQTLLNSNSSVLGHRISFNKNDLTATYEIYKGADTNLTFSQLLNNLLEFGFEHDSFLYKNFFLIGGEGEGYQRFYSFTNRDSTPAPAEENREFLFDSDVERTYYDDGGNEHTYGISEYSSLLRDDCKRHFYENLSTKKINGTINLESFTYGTDYNVGDIVTIKDMETGLSYQARLWSVTEVQDENGYQINADFEGEE